MAADLHHLLKPSKPTSIMLEDPNQQASLCHAYLVLSKKLHIGTPKANQTLRSLLESYGSMQAVYSHFFPPQLPGFEDGLMRSLEKRYAKIRFPFQAITINDQAYPECLKSIPNVSPVLYCQGNSNLLKEKTMAVVGTRKLEETVDIEEGRIVMARLVSAGYTIVSGLAIGCDTLAHTCAIGNKGNTIAVLGTPLDMFYPKENKALQSLIAKDHLVVSEFPIGLRAFPSYFVARDLTQVALSTEGVVVIRAGDRSGTMHAVRHCLDQKKQLYALKRNLDEGYNWATTNKQRIKFFEAQR